MDQKLFEHMADEFAQDVAYNISDLIIKYPTGFYPIVLACAKMTIEALINQMPPKARESCEAICRKVTVISLPKQMDPRKKGENET